VWPAKDDFPINWGFVFLKDDFFLPGYSEVPLEQWYWDDSLPQKADGQRGARLIYDIAVKTREITTPFLAH
jgi:hypothetical protein